MFEFLGGEPDGEPFAELWLGAHPTGPSTVETPAGKKALDELISSDQSGCLGSRVTARFGRLPYLVKLLAPARPLSMQVHPNPGMAQAGYAEEEKTGVPLAHPRRSFKDEHHKPEMVYALSRFEGLVGFRQREDVLLVLETLEGPLKPAAQALREAPPAAGMQPALEEILELTPDDIDLITETCRRLVKESPDQTVAAACQTVLELSGLYPDDVGTVMSLVLNRVVLQPGQLVFLGDGIPHAYLGGFGLELMANSDNVLRLGLTSKHIDIPAMLEALDFTSSGYRIESTPEDATTHIFRPPVEEFALSITITDRSDNGTTLLPGDGPRVLVCLEGSVQAHSESEPEGQHLTRGEAMFVGAAEGPITIDGQGAVAQAFVP
jgi:mannose-6-phosphate isomerase